MTIEKVFGFFKLLLYFALFCVALYWYSTSSERSVERKSYTLFEYKREVQGKITDLRGIGYTGQIMVMDDCKTDFLTSRAKNTEVKYIRIGSTFRKVAMSNKCSIVTPLNELVKFHCSNFDQEWKRMIKEEYGAFNEWSEEELTRVPDDDQLVITTKENDTLFNDMDNCKIKKGGIPQYVGKSYRSVPKEIVIESTNILYKNRENLEKEWNGWGDDFDWKKIKDKLNNRK